MTDQTRTVVIAGSPLPADALDHLGTRNETRMIVGSDTLRTRRTPVNWAVICLIDQIQRAHMAANPPSPYAPA